MNNFYLKSTLISTILACEMPSPLIDPTHPSGTLRVQSFYPRSKPRLFANLTLSYDTAELLYNTPPKNLETTTLTRQATPHSRWLRGPPPQSPPLVLTPPAFPRGLARLFTSVVVAARALVVLVKLVSVLSRVRKTRNAIGTYTHATYVFSY